MNLNSQNLRQIRISEKRQITIPKRFYDQLGMTDSLICELRDGELLLRPVPVEAGFSEEILKELLQEGYEGEELFQEFQKRKAKDRSAV
ncbi:AbrB/MazE/SpoVT family DNA-binding domain-containing protein, partial [Bhargavaea cecembensis]|uniref:AbrB/MazE/SpoVT family DNA-binding domain-containing protein n=1 Tax=Bhargavaea cecembensis TaxID=394098 RepID=UPI00058CDCEB